jgi:hypothetical protein
MQSERNTIRAIEAKNTQAAGASTRRITTESENGDAGKTCPRKYSQTERDRIQVALVALWSVFHPGKPLPIETQRGYLLIFETRGYSVDQVERAARNLLTGSEFFPRPYAWVNSIEGSPRLRAETAWSFVKKTLTARRVRKFGMPECRAEISNQCGAIALRVLDTFGTGPFVNYDWTDRDLEQLRRRWCELYELMEQSEPMESEGQHGQGQRGTARIGCDEAATAVGEALQRRGH